MKIAGYELDLLVVGFPGKSVCHGGMRWSTIALLRGHGRVALIDTGPMSMRRLLIERLRGHGLGPADVTDVLGMRMAMEILFQRPKDIGGGLTPLGASAEMSSHKGYGLAMLVHILAGTLSGSSFSPVRVRTRKPQDPDNLGHFFCAIDPGAFRDPGDFEDDMDVVIDTLRGTPPARAGEPVLVHGDLEAQSRERRKAKGIPLPGTLANKIRALCEEAQVPFLLTQG